MHVLILPSWYPREVADYSGSFFREQAIALSEAGLKIGVLAFVRHTRGRLLRHPGYWFGRSQRDDDEGVNTWRIHYGALSCLVGALTRCLQRKYFRQYCLREGTPDLLHAHCAIDGGTRARWLAQVYGLPYVITEHASAFSRRVYSTAQLQRARAAYAKARKNIVVSIAIRHDLHTNGISLSNHVIIPNMIPPLMEDAPWSPLPREKAGTFRFLCIGSLNENKRHQVLLSAFASGFQGQPVSLTIGGIGSLQHKLEICCDELRIADQVRFAGQMTRDQVLHEIDGCDALILASASETFGVVLLEATVRGKPIIATDCGGPRNIVTQDNGFLVQPDNVEALETAMLRMVRERRRFAPEIIRAQCLKHFGRHVVCSSIIGLYEEILRTQSKSL